MRADPSGVRCDLAVRWQDPPPPDIDLCYRGEGELDVLLALLPRGGVWRNSVQRAALAPYAETLGRWTYARRCDLADETDPRSVTELLERWERWLGIPDDCLTARTKYLPTRRQQIMFIERMLGGQSRRYFVELAALLGFQIEIEELAVAACGVGALRAGAGRTGRPLCLAFTWVVHVRCIEPRIGVTEMIAGCGTVGCAPVSRGRCPDLVLVCVLNRLKPAHTQVIVSFGTRPPCR